MVLFQFRLWKIILLFFLFHFRKILAETLRLVFRCMIRVCTICLLPIHIARSLRFCHKWSHLNHHILPQIYDFNPLIIPKHTQFQFHFVLFKKSPVQIFLYNDFYLSEDDLTCYSYSFKRCSNYKWCNYFFTHYFFSKCIFREYFAYIMWSYSVLYTLFGVFVVKIAKSGTSYSRTSYQLRKYLFSICS